MLSSQVDTGAYATAVLNPDGRAKGKPTVQMSPTRLCEHNAAPDRAMDPGEMGQDTERLVQLASKGDGLLVLEEAVDDGSVVKTAGTLFLTALEVMLLFVQYSFVYVLRVIYRWWRR